MPYAFLRDDFAFCLETVVAGLGVTYSRNKKTEKDQ